MGSQRNTSKYPLLISLEEAKNLSIDEISKYFQNHINPGQYKILKLLGFNKVKIEKAEGMYYYDQNKRPILDFFGGFGSLALGHNHPKIIKARKNFQRENRHEIAIAFMSQYSTSLAHNLSQLTNNQLEKVFFTSTGSEAVEYALKIAEKSNPKKRKVIAYAENAFHGKSRGALSVTDSKLYRSDFELPSNTISIPFGDIESLEKIFEENKSIGTLILETIQGGAGIIPAPSNYWKELRRLCNRQKIIWIADEVQCGVGRTGTFFAFEKANVMPDIITLAKSLGGGKAAIGAVISKKNIFERAYGSKKTALIHNQATFGGIGESCATAIETLNIIYDENLLDNCKKQGEYLISELNNLSNKYPHIIKQIRGEGLMVGIEFHDISKTLPKGLRTITSVIDEKLKGSLCGFIGSQLLSKYGILVAFTEYNRNVIRLEPPLIINSNQIKYFIDSMNQLLSGGVLKIIKDYLKT